MARRSCSIAITSDDSTILCADKFGDVYALPLQFSPEDEQNGNPAIEHANVEESKQYMPAASVLTVHSGRNRKVLEEQMKQASKAKVKTKESVKFKHDLLLGHVSMLTDIVYASVDGRGYIITADRDEHIRISRAPPQAHIIEGFCHGHEEFVSRLCLTPSGLLVSGGGDSHLFVWDWRAYRLQKKLQIRDTVLQYLKAQPHLASSLPAEEEKFKAAVTGIWSVDENRPTVRSCHGLLHVC
jgi:tRNA (guanine-N(7)-)-methyltransferase subunit TRM82